MGDIVLHAHGTARELVLADMIESIVGAAYLEHGLQVVCEWVGSVLFPGEEDEEIRQCTSD